MAWNATTRSLLVRASETSLFVIHLLAISITRRSLYFSEDWLRTAADKGHAAAQCNYGVCLESGRGVAKDEAAAAEWYRKAAEQGDAFATYNLGHMLAGGARRIVFHSFCC